MLSFYTRLRISPVPVLHSREWHLEPFLKDLSNRGRFNSRGKQCFSGLLASWQHTLNQPTHRLKTQFYFWPLDGPFNQGITPHPLHHYRHHRPQNGWQLLEIPGCVTTLRCTCCAIYAPPVLMPQQLERKRRVIIPATVQVTAHC